MKFGAPLGNLSIDSDEDEQGIREVHIAKSEFQVGDKNAWVCDSRCDYHLRQDATLFNTWSPLQDVLVIFKPLEILNGDLEMKQYGEVELLGNFEPSMVLSLNLKRF